MKASDYFLLAAAFLSFLLSVYPTPETRFLFHRRIADRVATLAPFLTLDPDPYIVLSEGKLYWICDAYTSTAHYPYSQPMGSWGNYIRNSVKAVVDAYNGTVHFYVAEPGEPIIQSYQKIFSGMFLPMEQMDPDWRRAREVTNR